MVDDWWQSAPGKVAAPPTLRWECGGGGAAIFPVYTVLDLSGRKKPDYVRRVSIILPCVGEWR